jgi:hypothetical protein
VEKYGTAGQAADVNIIRRMRIACWITKATDTHSEYVTLVAFSQQQCLLKRLAYSYCQCLQTESGIVPLFANQSFVLINPLKTKRICFI